MERHGGLLKEMVEKARDTARPETLDELRLLVQECECAKNRFSNRSGYSPVQRQIGQWPRVPGSLMSDESLDPALQVQNMTDEHERLLEFRRLAQEAFVRLSSKEAAARSLKSQIQIAEDVQGWSMSTGFCARGRQSEDMKQELHEAMVLVRGLHG